MLISFNTNSFFYLNNDVLKNIFIKCQNYSCSLIKNIIIISLAFFLFISTASAGNIGDINNNSENEVVLLSPDGLIYAFDKTGSVVPGFPLSPETGSVFVFEPQIADINGDGSMDIIVFQKTGSGGNAAYKLMVSLDNSTWHTVSINNEGIPGRPFSAPAFGNIDSDNNMEIGVPIAGDLSLSISDKIKFYKWDSSALVEAGSFHLDFLASDVNPYIELKDIIPGNKPELIVANNITRSLEIYEYSISTWDKINSFSFSGDNQLSKVSRNPTAGDLNDDGTNEIAVLDEENQLFLLDKNAGFIWVKELPAAAKSAPYFVDADNDGKDEVVVICGSEVIAYEFDGDEKVYDINDIKLQNNAFANFLIAYSGPQVSFNPYNYNIQWGAYYHYSTDNKYLESSDDPNLPDVSYNDISSPQKAGIPLQITINIEDPSMFNETVLLYYKRSGEAEYRTAKMEMGTVAGDIREYSYLIDEEFTSVGSLEFYFLVNDGYGNIVKAPDLAANPPCSISFEDQEDPQILSFIITDPIKAERPYINIDCYVFEDMEIDRVELSWQTNSSPAGTKELIIASDNTKGRMYYHLDSLDLSLGVPLAEGDTISLTVTAYDKAGHLVSQTKDVKIADQNSPQVFLFYEDFEDGSVDGLRVDEGNASIMSINNNFQLKMDENSSASLYCNTANSSSWYNYTLSLQYIKEESSMEQGLIIGYGWQGTIDTGSGYIIDLSKGEIYFQDNGEKQLIKELTAGFPAGENNISIAWDSQNGTHTISINGANDFFIKKITDSGSFWIQGQNIVIDNIRVEGESAYPPKAPVNLKADAFQSGNVYLYWEMPLSLHPEEGVNKFNIYRSRERSQQKELIAEGYINNSVEGLFYFQDTAPIEDTTYYYQVSAINSFGIEGPGSYELEVRTDNTLPPVPGNVAVKYLGNGNIGISWDPITSEKVTYNIYREDDPPSVKTLIKFRNYMNSYIDTVGTAGTYTYYIESMDDALNKSGQIPGIQITVPDVTPPSGNITLTYNSSPAQLEWNTDIDTSKFNVINIYKSLSDNINENSTPLAVVDKSDTTYPDTEVYQGNTYYYKIAFVDSANNILFSDLIIYDLQLPEINITSPVNNEKILDNTEITGYINDNISQNIQCRVTYSEDLGQTWNEIFNSKIASSFQEGKIATWFTHNLEDKSYLLKIKAADDAGNDSEIILTLSKGLETKQTYRYGIEIFSALDKEGKSFNFSKVSLDDSGAYNYNINNNNITEIKNNVLEDETASVVSPEGELFYMINDSGEIELVVDKAGTRIDPSVDNAHKVSPVFNNAGDKFAFQVIKDNNYDIYVAERSGSTYTVTPFANDPTVNEFIKLWYNDSIIYEVHGNSPTGYNSDIYIKSYNGTISNVISANPEFESTHKGSLNKSGILIYIANNRLYEVNLSAGSPYTARLINYLEDVSYAHFSPALDNIIAVNKTVNGLPVLAVLDITDIHLPKEKKIINNAEFACWAPDGVTFANNDLTDPANSDIVTANIINNETVIITSTSADEKAIEFNADGNKIIYALTDKDGEKIIVEDAQLVNITGVADLKECDTSTGQISGTVLHPHFSHFTLSVQKENGNFPLYDITPNDNNIEKFDELLQTWDILSFQNGSGTYLMRLKVYDTFGNMIQDSLSVDIAPENLPVSDITPPQLSNLQAERNIIFFNVSKDCTAEIKIYNRLNDLVRTLSGPCSPTSKSTIIWDGLDSSGGMVPDENLYFTIQLEANSPLSPIYQDRISPPPVTILTISDDKISPNNDGVQDKTSISIKININDPIDLSIKDSADNTVRQLHAGSLILYPFINRIEWDGMDNNNESVPSGVYNVVLSGPDDLTPQALSVEVNYNEAGEETLEQVAAQAMNDPQGIDINGDKISGLFYGRLYNNNKIIYTVLNNNQYDIKQVDIDNFTLDDTSSLNHDTAHEIFNTVFHDNTSDNTSKLFTRNSTGKDNLLMKKSVLKQISAENDFESMAHFSPQNKVIAYHKLTDKRYDIYLAKLDSSGIIAGPLRLSGSSDLKNENFISWSPDGSKFIYEVYDSFHSDKEVYLSSIDSEMNLVDSSKISIPSASQYFAPKSCFSPDGSKIAVGYYKNNQADFIIRDNTSTIQYTIDDPGLNEIFGGWYPVGMGKNYIAYDIVEEENNKVIIQNLDDSAEKFEINNASFGLFLQNGSRVIIHKIDNNDNKDLAVVNFFTGEEVLLTSTPSEDDRFREITGDRIIYTARNDHGDTFIRVLTLPESLKENITAIIASPMDNQIFETTLPDIDILGTASADDLHEYVITAQRVDGEYRKRVIETGNSSVINSQLGKFNITQTPVEFLDGNGLYEITLMVKDQFGNQKSDKVNIYIRQNDQTPVISGLRSEKNKLFYTLNMDCDTASIEIYNNKEYTGPPLFSSAVPRLQGENSYKWNGRDNANNILKYDKYYVKITAEANGNSAVPPGYTDIVPPKIFAVALSGTSFDPCADPPGTLGIDITANDWDNISINIYREENLKRSITPALSGPQNTLIWEGKDNEGNILPNEVYKITVTDSIQNIITKYAAINCPANNLAGNDDDIITAAGSVPEEYGEQRVKFRAWAPDSSEFAFEKTHDNKIGLYKFFNPSEPPSDAHVAENNAEHYLSWNTPMGRLCFTANDYGNYNIYPEDSSGNKPIMGIADETAFAHSSAQSKVIYQVIDKNRFDIYSADVTGSDIGTGSSLFPSSTANLYFKGLSPDGNRFAYESRDESGVRIFYNDFNTSAEIDAGSTGIKNLPGQSWNYNSDKIAYNIFNNGQYDLYIHEISANSTPIASSPANELFEAWSPVNNTLIYSIDDVIYEKVIGQAPGILVQDSSFGGFTLDGRFIFYNQKNNNKWAIYAMQTTSRVKFKSVESVNELIFEGISFDNSKLAYTEIMPGDIRVLKVIDFNFGAQFNLPPDTPTILLVNTLQNPYINNSNPIFSWNYIDPDSDPQTGIEIEISRNKEFTDIVYKSPRISHAIQNIDLTTLNPLLNLTDNKYYWRVKVYDDHDYESTWSTEEAYFILDTIPPVISFGDVTPDAIYNTPVYPTAVYEDINLDKSSKSLLLNTITFNSGDEVSADYNHILTASCSDLAGNSVSASISFIIDTLPPTADITMDPSFGTPPVIRNAGRYNVTVQFSEPIPENPELTWKDSSDTVHTAIVSDIPSIDRTIWYFAIDINGTATDGPAEYFISMIDRAGNTGSVINSGNQFEILTDKIIASQPGEETHPAVLYTYNTIHLCWQDNTSGKEQIVYRYSQDEGANWSPAENLSFPGIDSISPDITKNDNNDIYIAWIEQNDPNDTIKIRKKASGQTVFSPADIVKSSVDPISSVKIAGHGNRVCVVWSEWESASEEYRIVFSEYNGAAWAEQIITSSQDNFSPDILINNGMIHLTWQAVETIRAEPKVRIKARSRSIASST